MEELEALKEIIKKNRLSSQAEVGAYLSAKKIKVNQSTISRSLAKLNVAKIDGYYQLPAIDVALPSSNKSVQFHSAGDNLVVIKSAPGSANRIAFIIDDAKIPGVIGTIAGDDTIFLAVSQKKHQKSILNQINALVET